MLTKKEYISTVRDQISCEADAFALWDAYYGSQCLLQAILDLYNEKGRALRVRPEVVGLMLNRGCSVAQAKDTIASIYPV